MGNRRDFLKTVGTATAGAFVLGRVVNFAQGGRREVSIGGRRVKVVDMHAHAEAQEVEDVVRGTSLERTVNAGRIMGQGRIARMDALGIDVQVLSVNGYWWYAAADRDLASRIVRAEDEGLARWCDANPDRFVALSSVSLQYPDLAAEQLDHAVKNLGLRGASIGGHVNGEVPSSPRFDPFWAKAEELGVPVFVHPGGADNVIVEGGLDLRGDLGNIIGNPLETTIFLSQMIFDGTLDRFPGLKVCGSHAGGYLPSYFGRTEVACQVRRGADCLNQKQPSEYLKTQILADSMVFSEEGLRHLVAEMGVSQVVYGTDIRSPNMSAPDWPDTLDLILDAPSLSDAEKEAIVGGNLVALLRIES
jgi:aminocarboxymuconate-semialdehyde decarboxylase